MAMMLAELLVISAEDLDIRAVAEKDLFFISSFWLFKL